MYLQLDAVGDAETRAEGAALQDRLRYRAFAEEAERFAAANGLLVGGEAATRLLLGDPADPAAPPPLGLDSFRYDFHSGRAPAHALALCDAEHALEPQGLGHYAAALTKVPGRRLAVTIDGRDMFAVTALPARRGVRTADVLIPTPRPAQFASAPDGAPLQLACMGPEVQLVGVYAELCDPGRAPAWGGLLAAEMGLRALLGRAVRAKIGEAAARAAEKHGSGPAGLARRLYEQYAAGPDRVLVGPGAVAILEGRAPRLGGERIQVLAVAPLEAEAAEAAALARAEGLEARWEENDPQLPTDTRLRRLTVRVSAGRGARWEPVLDIFNAAAYGLVPYVTAEAALSRVPAPGRGGPRAEGGAPARTEARPAPLGARRGRPRPDAGWRPPAGLKVGTPFVLMRFRLVDLWVVQVLMQLGAVHADAGRSLLLAAFAGYEAAAAVYERDLADAAADPDAAAARLLPERLYVGRLEDPDLAAKREAGRPGTRFYPPYLPAARAEAAKGPGEVAG
jgi:hypothetical protein